MAQKTSIDLAKVLAMLVKRCMTSFVKVNIKFHTGLKQGMIGKSTNLVNATPKDLTPLCGDEYENPCNKRSGTSEVTFEMST